MSPHAPAAIFEGAPSESVLTSANAKSALTSATVQIEFGRGAGGGARAVDTTALGEATGVTQGESCESACTRDDRERGGAKGGSGAQIHS